MSELAAAAELPVATVKYYLREGLLPPGHATSATQATYDVSHVARLRLIRVLVGLARLSLTEVADVLARLDDLPGQWHQVLGVASEAARRGGRVAAADRGHHVAGIERASAVLADLGWQVPPQAPGVQDLQRALDGIEAADLALTPHMVATYAAAAQQIAELDVSTVPTSSPQEAARHVVLGTLLFEPLLLALRRLAHEDASVRRFPAPPGQHAGPHPVDEGLRET